jgi:7,8-dihydro-6-hydroxymethylpterin-pyrophosphokinase
LFSIFPKFSILFHNTYYQVFYHQHQSGFVLVPLAEIEPDFKVPVLGPIQALIDKLDISALIKL